MNKRIFFLYEPLYSFDLQDDSQELIRKEGYRLLPGVSIVLTPKAVADFYSNFLSKQYIQRGVSGKTKAAVIEVAICPQYCLKIDQSFEYALEIDVFIITCMRIVKESTVHINYILLADSKSTGILFYWVSSDSRMLANRSEPCVSFHKEDISRVTQMVEVASCRADKNKSFLSSKIVIAVELYYQSLLHDTTALKCIFYAIILECLFSPGFSELAHQISENVAFFLEPNNSKKRYNIYKSVKKFYQIRSELVHTGISKTLEKCEGDIIAHIRNIVALSIQKCLTIKEMTDIFIDNDRRIDYLRNIVIAR